MKIVFIAPRFHTNMHAYVRGLKQMGHEVFFLAMYKSNSEDYEDVEPIVISPHPLNRLFAIFDAKYKKPMHQWPCFLDLNRELSRIKPDVLLVKNLQGGLAFFSFLLGRFYAKKAFALVQTERYAVRGLVKKMIAVFLKNILGISGIISPLKNVLPQSDPWFNYLPFVIDVKDVSKTNFKGDNINILDIGKFQGRKDHLLLLGAVKSLKDKYPIRLTIVGEHHDNKELALIKGYINDNGLSDVVRILENVAYKKVLEMYDEFDLFVLPSRNEPAAYSPVEAFAHKLPAIASDTCGTSCYIDNGVNGYVFKSGDANDLLAKIEMAVSDRETLLKMGRNAFVIAQERHSLEYFKEKIGDILK